MIPSTRDLAFPLHRSPRGRTVAAAASETTHNRALLLLQVAISATSIAYSSTRIEGMYLDLGVAAGLAAARLVDVRRKNCFFDIFIFL